MNENKRFQKNDSCIFDYEYKKESSHKNWPRGEQKTLESLKSYAKLKEYNFTLNWVKPRVHLLNVQYRPWKIYFAVTWKIMDTSTITN